MESSLYGTTLDGHPVEVFTLRNANGLNAQVIEYGAILASMKVPDRDGIVSEITLNHQALGDWENDESFLGATVGRFGNRIARRNFLCDNPFGKRTGLCLEAEGFPDAPNQADFPNSILRPGEVYEHTLVFRFLVD